MTKKKPLAVGDRVRVYGRFWDWSETPSYIDGDVLETNLSARQVRVKVSDTASAWCHIKQCRRLIPKKRCGNGATCERDRLLRAIADHLAARVELRAQLTEAREVIQGYADMDDGDEESCPAVKPARDWLAKHGRDA